MNGLYDGEFVGFKMTCSEELDAALREAVVAIDANVLLDLYRFRPQRTVRGLMSLSSAGLGLGVLAGGLRAGLRVRLGEQSRFGLDEDAPADQAFEL